MKKNKTKNLKSYELNISVVSEEIFLYKTIQLLLEYDILQFKNINEPIRFMLIMYILQTISF